MKLHDHIGPSGVALGGIGVGYYQIDPTGYVGRCCVNNIHKSMTDRPDGMLLAVHDGTTAVRLQRDDTTHYGMRGYAHCLYTGLWPTVALQFSDNPDGVAPMGYSAFSGAVAQNVADSALPVVHYALTLSNDHAVARTMSALISWGDLIGRGIRDHDRAVVTQHDGESSEWHDMPTPATYADGVTLQVGESCYVGVRQYAKEPLQPRRATFQNYNNAFMLLAEQTPGMTVSILKGFDVQDEQALALYLQTGALAPYEKGEVALSAPTNGSRKVARASAVAIRGTVGAGESVTVRFAVSWYMPAFTQEQYGRMYRFADCDYNKYYHNRFSSIEALTAYALRERERIHRETLAWQQPLLRSSLPEWLISKQINSAYTLYSNGVLNQRGNFSTLEGEMGGYGGTMDQKMSSFPLYEKLYPSLNRTENRQYANVTGASGEIQHFDVHYYYGIADFDPAHRDNPTPAGSMTDNTGSWMLQLWNDYALTGDQSELRARYSVMTTSMAFLESKCPRGTAFPNYNTTYDDYSHPPMMIYSGTVWLCMLRVGARWAELVGDPDTVAHFRALYDQAAADVEHLYRDWQRSLGYGSFYAFGSDETFISSDTAEGEVKSDILFAGAMAGQYMSRLLGQGDVLPFSHFVSHMETFLRTSVQKSNDYYAPKVYNLRTEQDLDNPGSRCWPFYLDSYGAMAAIQAGFVEDGLAILHHTMLVDLRLGYFWTQNLWNRGYATYMTTTVAWMLGDVLAGASVDVPARTLTLGPVLSPTLGEELHLPLYYPRYHAMLHYEPVKGSMRYEILCTYDEEGADPLVFDTVVALPQGEPAERRRVIPLPQPFTVRTGAVLELSAYIDAFRGCVREALLTPVAPYVTPAREVLANGQGLDCLVTADGQGERSIATDIDFDFDTAHLPAPHVRDAYTLQLTGKLLPRYSQKYQLILEYTGSPASLQISLGNDEAQEVSDTIDAIESQQFLPREDYRYRVLTRELTAGVPIRIRITYQGDVSRGRDHLRLLWWSTTQQMGTIITERLYPPTRFYDEILGVNAAVTDCTREGDHMGYTMQGYRAIYPGIDFGQGGTDYVFRILAGAPDNHVSCGGSLEIRLGDEHGELLGTLALTPTGSWSSYRPFTTLLHAARPLCGEQDICLVFRPRASFLCNYTTFTFIPQR